MIAASTTERGTVVETLRQLADSAGVAVTRSWLPETLGLDYAWVDVHDNWTGVQRKELNDYVASLRDGRLSREIAQMCSETSNPVLVVEGRMMVSGRAGEGVVALRGHGPGVAYSGVIKQMLTIANTGIRVLFTEDERRTAEVIMAAFKWSMVATHSTGANRPAPTNDWGKPTNRDWQVHLLQGIDGVGRKTAEAILDTLGYCPLRVTASEEELRSVPGIGKVLARRIIASVNGETT